MRQWRQNETKRERETHGRLVPGIKVRLGRKRKYEGEAKAERNRQLVAEHRARARDITIPDVANPRRRAAASKSLRKFALEYFGCPLDEERFPGTPGMISMKFSSVHEEIIKAFEARIRYGGLQAVAAPRGYGKDTLAVIAAIWAVLYGHCRYFCFACFKASEAEKRIKTIKYQLENNKRLLEDFPEVCAPIRALERSALKARSQTANGEPTLINWTRHIILPTVRGSAASGSIIGPASINGSIRGENINGVRPDFVVISDPQTRKTASSPHVSAGIMDMINQDFGGLSSHGDVLSCLALVTVIKRGDIADRLTNPETHPQWNGLRYKAFDAWPERMDLWEQYYDLLRDGAKTGDTSGRTACKFYKQNRADMDAGALVTWPDAGVKAKCEDGSLYEVSAIQHFMNLHYTWGHEAFLTEYQNEPPAEDVVVDVASDAIAKRLSGISNSISPWTEAKITQGIDIGAREMHYVTIATTDDWTSSVIDYGIRPVIEEGGRTRSLEMSILDALRHRQQEVDSGIYCDPDGEVMPVRMTLVDSGYQPEIVYRFSGESGAKWQASKGYANRTGMQRYNFQKLPSGTNRGHHWYAAFVRPGIALVHVDVDEWKHFVHRRLLQDLDEPGGMSLYGDEPREHRSFAKHVTAEQWDPEKDRWIQKSKWNHFFDALVLACVAASLIGVRAPGADARELAKVTANVKREKTIAATQTARENRRQFRRHYG